MNFRPASASVARSARLGFSLLAATLVLAAVAGGLLRAGAAWPLLQGSALVSQAAGAHAALMLSAFLGLVIALERAVAVKRTWAFLAPAAAGCSGVLLLLDRYPAAAALGVLAAATSVAVHTVVWRRQPAAHTALLLLAALSWLVGNGLYAAGCSIGAVLPWWFALVVLTIAAERLEMTRLTRRPAVALPALLGIVALLGAGAALSSLSSPTSAPAWAPALAPVPVSLQAWGGVLYGAALSALALWLAVFDIARRTVFAPGLARYMAVSLLAGYAWLALAGLAWLGTALGCPGRDLALHALGLGFILSMVMGHAPVILPALLPVKLRFGVGFYLPLLALHASLLLRLVGGIGHPTWRTLGAELNAAALLLFALTLAASAWAARRAAARPRAWPPQAGQHLARPPD